MIDKEEQVSFNNQVDGFIKEIQEVFHLSYEEAIWMILDSILNSLRFQEEFYILKNETWNEKSVWIENLKIVQKYKKKYNKCLKELEIG